MNTDNENNTTNASEADLALARATLFGALALGFRPPTEETVARLVFEEGRSALADAAIVLDGDHESGLARHVKTLAPAGAATLEDLSASYRHIFGHTAASLVPPYETEYGSEAIFQQPLELGDLMGFYRAFGLTLNPAEHERADHISCECEFLSFLALKEAYALEKRDLPMLEEIHKATRLFLRDHLARFVPTFARKLCREDRGGFYGALGSLCYKLITKECSRLGLPVGPDNLGLRPAGDSRIPMACGSSPGCPEVPGACSLDGTEEG